MKWKHFFWGTGDFNDFVKAGPARRVSISKLAEVLKGNGTNLTDRPFGRGCSRRGAVGENRRV